MRIEIKRALEGRGFKLSLLIGILIALVHIYECVFPLYKYNAMAIEYNAMKGLYYPAYVLENWLGANSFSMEVFLYYLILPVLAVLPFGGSYYTERKQKVLPNLLVRITRRRYICNKAVAVFISGGIAVLIPLLLNLCVTGLFLPNLPPQPAEGSFMQDAGWFSEVYLLCPYLYVGINLLLNFLFAGLLSVLALGSSLFTENRFIVLLFPLLLHISCYSLLYALGAAEYSPLYIFQAGYMVESPLPIIIPCIVLIILNTIMIGIGVRNEEIY